MTPRPIPLEQIPAGTPDRLARLLSDGRAETVTPDLQTVAALWGKAVRALRSSQC